MQAILRHACGAVKSKRAHQGEIKLFKRKDTKAVEVIATEAKVGTTGAIINTTAPKVGTTGAIIGTTAPIIAPTGAIIGTTEAIVEATGAIVEVTGAKVNVTEAKVDATAPIIGTTEAIVEATEIRIFQTGSLSQSNEKRANTMRLALSASKRQPKVPSGKAHSTEYAKLPAKSVFFSGHVFPSSALR